MTPVPDQVLRGRRLVISATFFILFGDGAVILITMPDSEFRVLVASVLRWLITAGLLFAIWRGQRWARWLVVTLLAVGLGSFVPASIQNPNPLLIGLIVQFGFALVLLASPPSVTAFQAFQRGRKNA
jgi:hypothetical protein